MKGKVVTYHDEERRPDGTTKALMYYTPLGELRVKKAKLTMTEMAARVGISRTSYMNKERGMQDLWFHEAEKLATILDITLEELYTIVSKQRSSYLLSVLQ